MNNTQQQTVLVTGASGGIGRELVTVFAQEGYNLVLVALEQDALQDTADSLQEYDITVTSIVKDLTDSQAPQELYEYLKESNIQVDILVNNAGFAVFGLFAETNLEKEKTMLRLNIEVLSTLTKLFLPGMIQRGQGKILNVASTAAFQPGPYMAAYYASKAYVLMFSEAIASEVKGTGVTVTTLCPGPTATGFQQRADMEKNGIKLFRVMGLMDAKDVARIAYRGLMRGKSVVVPGWRNKVGVFMTRLAPRTVAAALTKYLQKPGI